MASIRIQLPFVDLIRLDPEAGVVSNIVDRIEDAPVCQIVCRVAEEGTPRAWPYLDFSVRAFNDEDLAIFRVMGYEDIDLLRRYCEMTLELFRDGRLE